MIETNYSVCFRLLNEYSNLKSYRELRNTPDEDAKFKSYTYGKV